MCTNNIKNLFRDNIYENAGIATMAGRSVKPLERYEFGRQKPLKTSTEFLVRLSL